MRRPFPLFRHDIDHATERVRAVKAALRSAQYFHARKVCGQHLPKIESTILARIVGLNSIDQYLGVIRISAAYKDRRLSAGPARLHNVKPGDGFEHFWQKPPLI